MKTEIGIVYCPNNEYYFGVYIDPELECDAKVSPACYLDLNTRRAKPGSIGIIFFRNVDCMKCGVIAHEAIHLATTYIRSVTKDKVVLGPDIDAQEEILADYVGWFAARLGELYWEQQ